MDSGTDLAQLLYAGAGRDPQATAVEQGREVLSYADLMQRVESAGAALQRLLPDRGSRVALCAANHVDHLVAYLAILVGGLVWVPLNPANGRALNAAIARRAQPDLLLVGGESVDQAPDTARCLRLGELPPGTRPFAPVKAAADDVAAIKFTGGTSGEPKGVVQTHGNMRAVIDNLQAFYAFGPEDRNLAIAPLTHGSSHYVFPILARGGCHRFLPGRSPASILAALEDGVTVTFMPPTLIYRLLRNASPSPGQFPRLRHLTYSAAAMPPSRIVAAQRAFGPRISTLYGLTEAPLTICGLGTGEMQDPGLRGTVGKACGSTAVRVVDVAGAEVPAGTVGQIEASGPIVMRGYLDDPVLTAATLRDGWLRTGDLGRLDPAGYLTLVGRASEVIISGGFNVYPAEIENVLSKAPGVRECCVYGVEDDYWGERIEAAVVLGDADTDAAERILAFVRRELGPVRTPKALHTLDALPRNAVGKVVRREMSRVVESKTE